MKDRLARKCVIQNFEFEPELVYKGLKVDRQGWGVEPVTSFAPGTRAGLANLQQFVEKRIKAYGASRNDPNVAALSNLSPWVNHGQVENIDKTSAPIEAWKCNFPPI